MDPHIPLVARPGAGGVSGECLSAFTPLVDDLAALVGGGGEAGCAVAVYVDGQPVADLWADSGKHERWRRDSLAVTFSVTKGLTALCVMLLADRGLLDPDGRVADYWPGYGVEGKESTTVGHVMTHAAGLPTFLKYWEVVGLEGAGLADAEGIAGHLARAAALSAPGRVLAYHALTYGYILGELVRRVTGMSIGRFFAEEVAGPLGLDLYIGLPAGLDGRVVPPITSVQAGGLEPAELQRRLQAGKAAVLRGDLLSEDGVIYSLLLMHPDTEDAPGYLARLFGRPEVQHAEIAAGGAVGDARSLARMYALLARGGVLDGRRMLSEAVIERFFTIRHLDDGTSTGMGLGFGAIPLDSGDLGLPAGARAFGHAGAGGAIGFADRERGLSLGFVKNQMTDDGVSTARVMATAYRCLAAHRGAG